MFKNSMTEHTYFVCKSSWCINITIFAEYVDFDNVSENKNAIKIADGIWLKFADKPINENAIFCDDDLPYLIKGLEIVQNQIINRSSYKNTLIIIGSLHYSICDFQEEGLTAAIMEWASTAFDFAMPVINVDFQEAENRYVFDFD